MSLGQQFLTFRDSVRRQLDLHLGLGRPLDPDDGGTTTHEKSGTVYPTTQRHMPEGLNLRDVVTKAMEQSASSEANCASASQQIPCFLRNRNFHCCVHKNPQLVPVLRQTNPFYAIPSNLKFILIVFSHLRLALPSGLFPSRFPPTLFSHIRAMCPAHLILLDSSHK